MTMVWLIQFRFCGCRTFIWRRRNRALRCEEKLRTFFKFSNSNSSSGFLGSDIKEYGERRLLGYSMDEMFGIVANVADYDKFVPWCTKATVAPQTDSVAHATIEVGFPPLLEQYKSKVTIEKPRIVKSVCIEGDLFKELVTVWRFSPGLPDNPRSCYVDFFVRFSFRSLLHSQVSHLFFDEVVKAMVTSFIKRAKHVHGKPSMPASEAKILTRRS